MKNVIMMMYTLMMIMFMLTNTPTDMIITIILQSVIMSIMLFMITSSSWMPSMIIITFTSGLMVMTALMINILPHSSKIRSTPPTPMLAVTLMISTMSTYLIMNFPIHTKSSMVNFIHIGNTLGMNLSMISTLMVIILMLTMLSTLKISYKKMGPLRVS